MIQNAEKDGIPRLAAEGDPRILPVGRLLRATRLDELPQVLNILKGDMSIQNHTEKELHQFFLTQLLSLIQI